MPATGEVNVNSMFVWAVRIVLPIILFVIWYITSQGKGESWSSDDDTRHPREDMLGVRDGMKDGGVPASLGNIKLVEAEDPRLGGAPPARATRGSQGARAKRGDKARTPSDQIGGKAEGKVSREDSYADLDQHRSAQDHLNSAIATLQEDASDDTSARAKTGRASLGQEELLHFESLVNFVAFGHKARPQRVFLPTESRPPPPPPSKETLPAKTEDESLQSLKANVDAQMVLKCMMNGKIGLKQSDIAQDIHQHLFDSQVKIVEPTFVLLVEACIHGGDLQGASRFLTKMEANGLCPDSDLLDKVMDLYSETRAAEVAVTPSYTANETMHSKIRGAANLLDRPIFGFEADEDW